MLTQIISSTTVQLQVRDRGMDEVRTGRTLTVEFTSGNCPPTDCPSVSAQPTELPIEFVPRQR